MVHLGLVVEELRAILAQEAVAQIRALMSQGRLEPVGGAVGAVLGTGTKIGVVVLAVV